MLYNQKNDFYATMHDCGQFYDNSLIYVKQSKGLTGAILVIINVLDYYMDQYFDKRKTYDIYRKLIEIKLYII